MRGSRGWRSSSSGSTTAWSSGRRRDRTTNTEGRFCHRICRAAAPWTPRRCRASSAAQGSGSSHHRRRPRPTPRVAAPPHWMKATRIHSPQVVPISVISYVDLPTLWLYVLACHQHCKPICSWVAGQCRVFTVFFLELEPPTRAAFLHTHNVEELTYALGDITRAIVGIGTRPTQDEAIRIFR